MLKKVEEHIRQLNMIQEGNEVIAGVSGGADSICMLLQLCEYKKKCPFELKVVHINHLIREDAGEDAAFVENICKRWNIPFYLFEEDVVAQAKELGLSTEEAGRRIRYIRFNQVKVREDAKIAVAHNRNDVAETVLFNIFRGTGIEGLASLLPVNGNIIRPMLGITRAEIEAYLSDVGQEYRTDSTNAGTDYARNKIRNVVLPYAEEQIVNDAISHIAELSEKMIHVREYIRKETDKAYREIVDYSIENERTISIDKFLSVEYVLQSEIVLLCLEELTDGRKDIGSVHVESIISILSKDGEKKVDLPYNLEAVKQYDKLIIRKKAIDKKEDYELALGINSSIRIGEKNIITRVFEYEPSMDIPQNSYTKWFDYDKIIECLMVRTRHKGDYITVNDKMQKKSLKDYFIDCKIPKEKRDSQMLLADGSHIVWVLGHRISEYYKITEDTKHVIEIKVEILEG